MNGGAIRPTVLLFVCLSLATCIHFAIGNVLSNLGILVENSRYIWADVGFGQNVLHSFPLRISLVAYTPILFNISIKLIF